MRLFELILAVGAFCAPVLGISQVDTVWETTLPILEVRTLRGEDISNGFLRQSDLYIYDSPTGINRLIDTAKQLSDNIFIRFRGSSSLGFPKKNYAFTVRDSATQNDVETSFFGFPAHEDWTLHGPYSDKSLMRNALAYKWARNVTPWAPRTKYVNVVVNGSFEGVYLFTEAVNRDKNRVDLAKLKPTDTFGTDLTGGYMLQIGDDPQFDYKSFRSLYSQTLPPEVNLTQLQLEYPDFDSIGSGQFEYIRDFYHDIENRLFDPAFTDAAQGYRNYVDIKSWVDFAIIQEISGNYDAFRRSTWVVKNRDDEGGRFAAGPAWDFNIAFGNEESCLGQGVSGWMTESNGQACDFRSLPYFVWRMFEDPVFKARMRARWEDLRQNLFSDAKIAADIDSLEAVLSPAQPADQARWNQIGTYVWPNAFIGQTWEEEVDYLRDWINRRVAWIDSNIIYFPELSSLQTRLTNLPIVRVDIPNGDSIPKNRILATMSIIDNGASQLNSPEGASTGYFGKISIELRGEKEIKSTYSFETKNDRGEDYPYMLMGMAKEEDWVLKGPFADKSLVRDALGFELSRVAGAAYAPDWRSVVLYINGQYEGIYLLTEEIKRDKNRIDIAKLNPDENSGDDLTGGYLLEIDDKPFDPEKGFLSGFPNGSTSDKTFYQYHTPDEDDISPTQKTYIKGKINELETAIKQGGFAAAQGLIDSESFINYMLVQELGANSSAYRNEFHLVKDKDSASGRIKAGPVVEFHHGFGNDDSCGGMAENAWIIEDPSRCQNEEQLPFWLQDLWADSEFRRLAAERWTSLRQSEFSNQALQEKVKQLTHPLEAEADQNFLRYPILGQPIGQNAFIGQTYSEEVAYLASWLVSRAIWMDENVSQINSGASVTEPIALRASPNPGLGAEVITISFDQLGSPGGDKRLELVDALGRTVFSMDLANAVGKVELPIQGLHAGMYYIRLLIDGSQRGVIKWIR